MLLKGVIFIFIRKMKVIFICWIKECNKFIPCNFFAAMQINSCATHAAEPVPLSGSP